MLTRIYSLSHALWNGLQGMDSGLQPINVKLYISLHPDTKPRDPPQSDSVQGGSQSHPSCCTLEVGRGQRHTVDAVPDHCSFQARLWMYCVWHSIQYQFTTTWQHPQRWAKTGTWGIFHQPSLQYVHRGQPPVPEWWDDLPAAVQKTSK